MEILVKDTVGELSFFTILNAFESLLYQQHPPLQYQSQFLPTTTTTNPQQTYWTYTAYFFYIISNDIFRQLDLKNLPEN
jgi:hypothetical protein